MGVSVDRATRYVQVVVKGKPVPKGSDYKDRKTAVALPVIQEDPCGVDSCDEMADRECKFCHLRVCPDHEALCSHDCDPAVAYSGADSDEEANATRPPPPSSICVPCWPRAGHDEVCLQDSDSEDAEATNPRQR